MTIKLINIFSISLTLIAFIPISAQATSKKEGIQLCLKELNIKKQSAKLCKENHWNTDECANIRKRLKPCVRSKVMGY